MKNKSKTTLPTREEFIANYRALKPKFTEVEAGEVYDVLNSPECFKVALKEWSAEFARRLPING